MSEELDALEEYISQAGAEAAQAVMFELIKGLADEVEALKLEVARLRAQRNSMPLIGDNPNNPYAIGDDVYRNTGNGNIQWYTNAINTVNMNTTYGATTTQA